MSLPAEIIPLQDYPRQESVLQLQEGKCLSLDAKDGVNVVF